MAVHVTGTGGDGAFKGVVVHGLEDFGSLNKGRILQTVGINVLAANGFDNQRVPEHGGPGILAGHLAHGIVALRLGVFAELEELIIGGGEMIPADVGKDLGVVDRGEDCGLKGESIDLSVNAPCIKGAVGEILAPAFLKIRGQIHELAGFGIALDIIGGIHDAEVGRCTGGDGGAQLVAGGLIVALLLDNDLDGAGVLSIEVFNQLSHVGGLGVGADPDAGEVDDDLIVCGISGNRQRDDHDHHKQQGK